jgi:hypothetical protein
VELELGDRLADRAERNRHPVDAASWSRTCAGMAGRARRSTRRKRRFRVRLSRRGDERSAVALTRRGRRCLVLVARSLPVGCERVGGRRSSSCIGRPPSVSGARDGASADSLAWGEPALCCSTLWHPSPVVGSRASYRRGRGVAPDAHSRRSMQTCRATGATKRFRWSLGERG